jgi:GNAT superfamily N-acetyltransferase
MPSVNFVVRSDVERTARVKQLESMFDVPAHEKIERHWSGAVPIEDFDWNVGLIVGHSGAGKSSVAKQLFGEPVICEWDHRAVVDNFPARQGIADITAACQAVGFNTIPSWMKPYGVLSTGEKFRVDLARALLSDANPIVVDEFTSVIDRQVAQIGSHAAQKYVRKAGKKFVAVTCHYDVEEWLQPDWILEPATMTFTRRAVRRRPEIEIEIKRVSHAAWSLFAPFHYLTAELHRSAACYVAFVRDQPAAFAACLHRPHPSVNDIKAVSRLVTLPDWQGLGIALALVDELGAAHRALGLRLRTYPAHPALVRSFDRSPRWRLEKKPGTFSAVSREKSTLPNKIGGRPCAVFEYCGKVMDKATAKMLMAS